MNQTLYLKIGQSIVCEQKDIFLGSIANMWCVDNVLLAKCKALKVVTIHADKDGEFIFSVLDIIQKIQEMAPNLEVVNLGEMDFVVEYRIPKHRSMALEWAKTAAIFIIIFFGAAFAIMTFNNDVSVKDVFDHIYELIMGESSSGFNIIQFMYAVGLFLGIGVFYNHFAVIKLTKDPTPLEVEMRQYEQQIYTTKIENKHRMDKIKKERES